VSASAAQRRRVNGDKKIASYVTKRGMVPDPSAERRKDKLPVSKYLIGFFMVVLFGSTLLQVINKMTSSSL